MATADEEEEPTMTYSELLEQIDDEENELDRERALYGNCDVDTCTYPQGYVKRQALFVCITCYNNNNGQLAGVCAACAYHCHANHEVNELYTRRFFRCDCGNSKCNQQPCKLYPNKDPENASNKYDDNFRGLYCTCKRPYPDKEAPAETADDPMLQCMICEDWFHSQHLGVPLPMEENDADQMDIVCQACVTQHPFLAHYDESRGTTSPAVDTNATASNTPPCRLVSNANNHPSFHTIFLRDGWRKRLCRCAQCCKLYDESNLTAVFDDDDAIQEYEKQALAKSENLDADKLLENSLQKLNHVKKLEVLHGINEFKQSLGDFLRSKANGDGVLTTDDVTTFFAGLQEKRKQKQTTMHMPPDNCKF